MTLLPLTVTLTTAGALGLLLLLLASRVSQLRFQHRIAYGDGGNPALLRAIRAHGNTAEHAPVFLVLLLACELAGGSSTFLAVVGAAFVLARLVFVAGVLGRGLNPLRIVGAGMTYALHLVIVGAALATALR